MIKLENITKTYGKYYGRTTTALKGISVTFGDRGLVFVLGKSGSGKSTLLNLIGGIDKPTSGEIIVDGRAVSGFKPSELDGYRNTSVGFVFQEYNLLPEYSVGKNIGLAIELQGKKAERERIEQALREVDLVDNEGNTLYERRINELSGGQKQRVAVARALIKDPRVILADEPTGALDVETGEALYGLLKELSRDRLIIVVTHDVDAANKYGDRKIKLVDGKIAADTKEGEEEQAECEAKEPTEYKRGKLPVKRAFFMGAMGLKNHKLRLGIITIISSLMCFVIGMISNYMSFDKTDILIDSIYAEGESPYVIVQSEAWEWHPFRFGYEMSIMDYPVTAPTERQMKALNGHFDKLLLAKGPIKGSNVTSNYASQYEPFESISRSSMEYDQAEEHTFNPYIDILYKRFDALVELNSITGEKDATLSPDPRFVDKSQCRLPRSFDEIAISDAKFDMFVRFGYKDEEGNTYRIEKPDDLIGKKIIDLTVVGIYSTTQKREKLLRYDKDYYYPKSWFDEGDRMLDYENGTHVANFGYVCDGYFRNERLEESETQPINDSGLFMSNEYPKYVVKLSGFPLADKLFFSSGDMKYSETNEPPRMKKHFRPLLLSAESHAINRRTGYMKHDTSISLLGREVHVVNVLCVLGLFFFLVFISILSNYLSISLSFRRREFGILRELGCSKRDVRIICLLESILVGGIVFVLTVMEIAISCGIVNLAYYHFHYLALRFIPFLTVMAVCFGITVLVGLRKSKELTRRQPARIMRDS